MKNKLILTGLLAAGLFTGYHFGTPATAQNNPQQIPEVLILHIAEWGKEVLVYLSSSSPGAPKFPHTGPDNSPSGLTSASEAMAIALRQGFRIHQITDYIHGGSVIMIKP